MDRVNYDFVEIGTSDFDTLIQEANDTDIGLSIEPIKAYLDRLPNKQNVTKVCAAVSPAGSNENIDIHYIPPEVIEKNGHHPWLKGCNKIGEIHPLILNPIVKQSVVSESVKQITINELYKQYNIHQINLLKIDTEGYDCDILQQWLLFLKDKDQSYYPKRIMFETNIFTNVHYVYQTIEDFMDIGYKIESFKYDNKDGSTVLILKDFVNEPVVSIIIPVFKNVFWLIEAINSLLNQTYKQFEIIIVNDCSKENVDDIINLYSHFPNIKYYKHAVNKGVSAARNTGISHATGKYILPFDSDDVAWDINWLNDCIKIIDENTIVTTPYNYCDRNMHPLNEIWPPREFEFSEITNRGGIIVNSSMYPKALWTKNNGYDENLYLYEDADFWLGAYFKGYKLKHLKSPRVHYRIHGTSLSDSNITIKESAWNYIRKKHNLSTTWEQILAND